MFQKLQNFEVCVILCYNKETLERCLPRINNISFLDPRGLFLIAITQMFRKKDNIYSIVTNVWEMKLINVLIIYKPFATLISNSVAVEGFNPFYPRPRTSNGGFPNVRLLSWCAIFGKLDASFDLQLLTEKLTNMYGYQMATRSLENFPDLTCKTQCPISSGSYVPSPYERDARFIRLLAQYMNFTIQNGFIAWAQSYSIIWDQELNDIANKHSYVSTLSTIIPKKQSNM